MITTRRSLHNDPVVVAPKLRESDLIEIKKSTGQGPLEVLSQGFLISEHCWTMLVDGAPEAMFGLAPYEIGKYRPWFLSSYETVKHKQEFLSVSKERVDRFKELVPFMENFVDADNDVAVRWLEKIGFEIDVQPVIMGVSSSLFYRFFWERN